MDEKRDQWMEKAVGRSADQMQWIRTATVALIAVMVFHGPNGAKVPAWAAVPAVLFLAYGFFESVLHGMAVQLWFVRMGEGDCATAELLRARLLARYTRAVSALCGAAWIVGFAQLVYG
jgi:hypothetical protein